MFKLSREEVLGKQCDPPHDFDAKGESTLTTVKVQADDR